MNETAITLRQAWQYGGPLMWVLAGLSVLALAKILVLLVAQRRGALAPRALLLHTGDLIDFTSKANYDAVVEHFAGRDSFVCAGNHEFVPYFWETDKEDAAYKAKSYAATQANFPNDLTFAARVVNGVNFVAIDDVFYYTTERQAELFEREVAKGLPIVLLCHVPLYSPELFKVAFKKWRTAAYLCGVPDGMMSRYRKRQVEQQRADKTTMDFVSRLRSEPLLKAILCGHIHTTASRRRWSLSHDG